MVFALVVVILAEATASVGVHSGIAAVKILYIKLPLSHIDYSMQLWRGHSRTVCFLSRKYTHPLLFALPLIQDR